MATLARDNSGLRVSMSERRDYSQAMAVALAFYLLGHIAFLVTAFLVQRDGVSPNDAVIQLLMPRISWLLLLLLQLPFSVATSRVFWRLRRHPVAVLIVCVAALALIYLASINSLAILEVAMATRQ